jgi:hypothetical protein
MASKMNKKILTLLMIMVSAETHGEFAPTWHDYGLSLDNHDLFDNILLLLGVDVSSWSEDMLTSGNTFKAQVPTNTIPISELLGYSGNTASTLQSAITGIQTTLGPTSTTGSNSGIIGAISTANTNTTKTNTTLGRPAIPASGSTPETPAVTGLITTVQNNNDLLTNATYGLDATNTDVNILNANIGTPVNVSGSNTETLFANQEAIDNNIDSANSTLTNTTYGLAAINSAVNTNNTNIGAPVAVSESAGPTLFDNQEAIVKNIKNTVTAENDDIANSIVVAQNAVTGAETTAPLGSLGALGQSIAASTAATKSNIRVAQNTVTGAETGTALGSLGATGQSIAMSTAATGGNITAGTAATALDVQAAQNTVTGSPSGTPLGSLSDGGQSTVDSEMTTQGNITAAQNTVTGSEMKTPLGYISQTGQSIAGSTIATKINITDAQNTVTGSPSTTPLGYLAPGGQSIAGSTAATAGNTESALMLVQNAITGAEIGTSLGSLGTTGQNIAESTTLTADTVTTAQNTLQGNNPLATLSGIVTSIGDPTVATTPGTSGATIQGTQTAMASDAAVALTKVDASLAKIEKTTEKTANTALQRADSGVTLSDTVTFAANPTLATVSGAMGATMGEIPTAMASDAAISSRRVDPSSIQIPGITDKTAKNIATTKATKNGANPKKGGLTSRNTKGAVNKGTSVANNKTIKRK